MDVERFVRNGAAAKAAAEEAIDNALAAAHKEFLVVAERYARVLAKMGAPFTANDVRDHMAKHHPYVRTHDDRALGGVFRRLAREGVIRKVGYVASERRRNHDRPTMQWVGA